MDAKTGGGRKDHRVEAFYYFRNKENPNRKEIKVCLMSVIPALGRYRQYCQEFGAILASGVRLYL